MAARDDNISDVELRRQLKAFGEDAGPVTDTTRPFLLRKLKRLQNEGKSNKSSAEKPAPRRATPRRSLPATRNQSPSRKMIGFSSDEEDAQPSLSGRLVDSSRLRGRRRDDTATTLNESSGRGKSKPTTPQRSKLRPREPSFIDSVPEKILDTSDGNSVEFSDSDGQAYSRSKSRGIGITRYLRPVKRERGRKESERSETTIPSTSYDNNEQSVITADSELDLSFQERPAGARLVKRSSFWSSTIKIALVISTICVAVLLYVTLKSHSSEKTIPELGKNIT